MENHIFARKAVLSTIEELRYPEKSSHRSFDLYEACEDAWKWFLEYERERSNREIRTRCYDNPNRRVKLIQRNSVKRLSRKHRTLYNFMFTNDEEFAGLRDRFVHTLILYITNLINIETMKWKKLTIDERKKLLSLHNPKNINVDLTGKNNNNIGVEEDQENRSRKQEAVDSLQEEEKQAKVHLLRVSFIYSILLQRLRKIFLDDRLGESKFFEGLTRVCVHICIHQFDNEEVHDLIEKEIMQFFRSNDFVDNHKSISGEKFVPTRKLYRLLNRNRYFPPSLENNNNEPRTTTLKKDERNDDEIMNLLSKSKHAPSKASRIVCGRSQPPAINFSPMKKWNFCHSRSPILKVTYPNDLSNIGNIETDFEIPEECVRNMHKKAQLDIIKGRRRKEKTLFHNQEKSKSISATNNRTVISPTFSSTTTLTSHKRTFNKNVMRNSPKVRKGIGDVSKGESSKLQVEIKMQELQTQISELKKTLSSVTKRIERGNDIDKALEFRRRSHLQNTPRHPFGNNPNPKRRFRGFIRGRKDSGRFSSRSSGSNSYHSNYSPTTSPNSKLPSIFEKKMSRFNVGLGQPTHSQGGGRLAHARKRYDGTMNNNITGSLGKKKKIFLER